MASNAFNKISGFVTANLQKLETQSRWRFKFLAFMDYISFCSILPSPTSSSCKLVDFSTQNRQES
jgi:hypothetical protein